MKDSLLTAAAQGAPVDSSAVNSSTISFTSAADTAAGDSLKSVQRKITLQNIGGFAGDGVVPNYRLGVFDNAGSEFASFNGKTQTVMAKKLNVADSITSPSFYGHLYGTADSSKNLYLAGSTKYFPADSFMLASRPDTNLAKQWFNDTLFMATGKSFKWPGAGIKDTNTTQIRIKTIRLDTVKIGLGVASAGLDANCGFRLGGGASNAYNVMLYAADNDNVIGSFYNVDADENLYLFYYGYLGSNTRYRGLKICNGKGVTTFTFDGATGGLWAGSDSSKLIISNTGIRIKVAGGKVSADTLIANAGLSVGNGTMIKKIITGKQVFTALNTVDTTVISGVAVASRISVTVKGRTVPSSPFTAETTVDTLFVVCAIADTAIARAKGYDYEVKNE